MITPGQFNRNLGHSTFLREREALDRLLARLRDPPAGNELVARRTDVVQTNWQENLPSPYRSVGGPSPPKVTFLTPLHSRKTTIGDQ